MGFDLANHLLHPCYASASGYAAALSPILPNPWASVCRPFPLGPTERSGSFERIQEKADFLIWSAGMVRCFAEEGGVLDQIEDIKKP